MTHTKLDPMYRLTCKGQTVMIGKQAECLQFLTATVGAETTVGELRARGWRIVPARPSALSEALLAVSGW